MLSVYPYRNETVSRKAIGVKNVLESSSSYLQGAFIPSVSMEFSCNTVIGINIFTIL